ncbi:MAG: hypothetical protein EZS28_017982 [Streblomastix strix]|uniref:Protein kinase domain-containing protein n=1 Tax=Streblomastix strix TaxID=222440 RepID=A0A5J4VUW8_9EUKA|nr:MAG: hypothetical protein EZS28_017982 [Streblomastix strix]
MDWENILRRFEFIPINKLGQGSFGCVYLAYHNDYGIIAVKIYEKEKYEENEIEAAIRIGSGSNIGGQEMKNIFMLRIIGSKVKDQYPKIITEYANMKTLEIIAQQIQLHLPTFTLRALMLQMRVDIKLENILLHSPPGSGRVYAKISDYGFTQLLGYSMTKRRDVTNDPTQLKGSRPYMAPELFQGQVKLTQKIDVYALGVTFYVMIVHRFPLNQPTFQEQKRKLAQMNAITRPQEIKDDLLWNLLSKMLEFDPEKRITSDEAMHHPYFTGPQAIADFSPEQLQLVQQAKQAKEIGDKSITEYDMDPYFTVAESEIKKI